MSFGSETIPESICIRDCSLLLKTPSEYATYRFNNYDAGGEEWSTSPENMVDASLNYASTESVSGVVEYCTSTSYPPLDEYRAYKVFDKVEFRIFAFYNRGTAVDIKCRPVFYEGDGSDFQYSLNETYDYAEWTDWEDITYDTNAPDIWYASDIVNLGMDVERAGAGTADCVASKIEIRVQWHYEIPVIFPHREGINDSFNKILTLFNFWTDDYDIIDEGMNGDAFSIKGLDAYCPNIMSSDEFNKKWHLLETLADAGIVIQIDTLDKTYNGTFVIKSIGTSSVHDEKACDYNISFKRKTYEE